MNVECYRCGKVVFESELHVQNGHKWHRRCWDAAVAEGRAMLTTEAGGGVPEELRERLELLIRDERMMYHSTPRREFADAILAEIAAAGFELVASDRMDRLVALADLADDYCQSGITGEWTCRCAQPEPGDLDRGGR